jgi:hypothetical protein
MNLEETAAIRRHRLADLVNYGVGVLRNRETRFVRWCSSFGALRWDAGEKSQGMVGNAGYLHVTQNDGKEFPSTQSVCRRD